MSKIVWAVKLSDGSCFRTYEYPASFVSVIIGWQYGDLKKSPIFINPSHICYYWKDENNADL